MWRFYRKQNKQWRDAPYIFICSGLFLFEKGISMKVLYKDVADSLLLKPRDCANCVTYNGQKDWCAIRDTKCPMLHGIQLDFSYFPPKKLHLCPILQDLNTNKSGQLIQVKQKNCVQCGDLFSNSRSHYCPFCRNVRTRDKARQRKQKQRNK